MYALILAGGFATRLWPITKDFPKPLLPLGRKRIIEFVIERIGNIEGLKKIFISTNEAFQRIFGKWIKESEYAKSESMFELIIEPTRAEEEKLGAIRGINYDLQRIFSMYETDDILIVAGDNVPSINFKAFIDFYRKVNCPLVAVYEVESYEVMKKLGEVSVDESGKVIGFREKPKQPKSKLAATAIYMIPKDMVNLFEVYLKEGRNPDAPGYFFEWLSKNYDVYAYKFSGYWFDIGSLEGYISALKTLLTDNYISPSADIRGKIIPPVCIGEGVRIDSGSEVGPYAIIERGVEIHSSRIHSSLIMEGSEIRSSTISESMVGYKSKITGGKISRSILSSHTKLNII